MPARGILPNKQLEQLQSPFEELPLTGVGSARGREPTLCVHQTSASPFCAGLGRVNRGSTAPEDPGLLFYADWLVLVSSIDRNHSELCL